MVRLQRFVQKCLLSGFEMVFTVYAVLFLEHWMLFSLDWRYGCEDKGENINMPALKLDLRHGGSIYQTLVVILRPYDVGLSRHG